MLSDLRMCLRQLMRSPGHVAVTVVTLALGIGGLTAVFTLADPVMFRPLAYADSERVVQVRARVPQTDLLRLHADDFAMIAERSRTLDAVSTLPYQHVGRFAGDGATILGGGVSREFLRLTGLRPVLGRWFAPNEYEVDGTAPPSVAMLTWAFWHRAFGGATDVVGTRLELAQGTRRLSMEVVGVLPREFFYPETLNEAPSFITPGRLDAWYFGRANAYPTILARVRPEYTFAQAEAELDALLAAVERDHPSFEQGRKARLIPLQELLFRGLRTPLLLLFIATGCLLALACVNLAHLAQARSHARARDLAVRLALGAGRWRIIRLHLAEAGILAILGGLAGVVVGNVLFSWGISRTPRFSHVYRLLPAEVDSRVVMLVVAAAALVMIVIGLVPAVRAVRSDLRPTLSSLPGRRRGWRLGSERLAILGQTAFAVGIVVTCLLVVRSFVSIVSAERGFDPARVRLADLDRPDDGSPSANADQYRRLVAALGGVRGVEAAAVGNGVPGMTLTEPLLDSSGDYIPNVVAYQVSERFVAAMGMTIEEGRLFDESEAFGGAPLAVVDRSVAEALWPGQPALGKTIRKYGGREFTVVGVLRRVRANLFEDTPSGVAFVTLDTTSEMVVNRLSVVLRLDSRRPATESELGAAAEATVHGLVWHEARGLSAWERVLGQPRFLASALGVLAGLTILLAGFGVLGVVSHLVSRRTREIGIRIALGADRRRVRLLVVRQAAAPALVGVGCGLLLALWWSASVRAVITGISPHDPWSFAAAGAAAMAAVLVASARPAARASRIEPAVTLRAE